jgi:diguanylate cyclase (GGDEF)-like protein/PAS domain S-box-containing protein
MVKFKKQWIQQLLKNPTVGIAITDKNGNHLYVNSHLCNMTGYTVEDLVGNSSALFHASQESYEKFAKIVLKLLLDKETITLDYPFKHKNGKLFWANISGILVEDTQEMLWTMVDITQRVDDENKIKNQQKILKYQATHDALTGLPNRLLFHDRLEQSIKKSKRNKVKMALFFIDLDGFKEVNDTMGHKIGDAVLFQIAKNIRRTVREEDSVARLGGDEFTVIMEDIKNKKDIALLAEKIVTKLSEEIEVENETISLSCSLGISIYPNDSTDADTLLSNADTAMYDAKAKGKNNFQFYSLK